MTMTTSNMDTRRSVEIAHLVDELACVDPSSPRARDLRHTIKMNERYMEEPYTDSFTQNSLGNTEMGRK